MTENIDFELKKINDVSIFRLNEKRFDASIAGLVKGEFTILLQGEGANKLIIDLAEVEYCDSSGLSAILLAYRMLQAEGGEIRLASPTKSVKTLIEISQLDRILPIYSSVDEALGSLQSA